MTIILIPLCFFVALINIGLYCRKESGFAEIFLHNVLLFSFTLLLFTETLSLLEQINFKSISIVWTTFLIVNTLFVYLRKEESVHFVREIYQQFIQTYRKLNKIEKFSLYSIIAILILILFQGIFYPPNTYDTMTYHLPRIVSWISQESVNHFPTNTIRQVYQPPFLEFVVLHINLLSSSDYFSNSVQLFFLVFSVFVVILIVDQFGLKRKYKILACLLVVTIPEVILQASSVKNDIVVTFFILSTIYFAIKSSKKPKAQNFFFLGVSAGLGFMTKGTAYIYLAPVVLIFTLVILFNLYKTRKHSYVTLSIFAIIIILLINSGHYLRNYELNNHILGLDEQEKKLYQNEKMTPKLLISNILKNAGLHIDYFPITKIAIHKYHKLAEIKLNNAMTNYKRIRYRGGPEIKTNENYAPNPIHFFLIITSLILVGLNSIKNMKKPSIDKLCLLLILTQAGLFCFYLKWQPWHSRLHITLFLVSIPLICFALNLYKKHAKIVIYSIIPIIILYAFYVVLFNSNRPYIPSNKISITSDRYKKYFAHKIGIYEEYKLVSDNLAKENCKNIGIYISDNEYQYPLLIESYKREIHPVHINVSNFTRNTFSEKNRRYPDCIVSNLINDRKITFLGISFVNISSKNRYLQLYNKSER